MSTTQTRVPVSPLRRLSFRAQFAVTSGLLLLVAGLVLSQLLAQAVERRAQAAAEQAGVLAARLGVAPILGPEAFSAGLSDAQRAELDRMVGVGERESDGLAAASGHLVRIKVFDAAGTMVYSDLPELVGRTFDTPDLRRALGGEILSKETSLDDPDEYGDQGLLQALEVYVPLRYDEERPVGVAEVYLPYEPVQAAIAADTRLVYLTIAGVLVAFFLLMFRMVSRASRRMIESVAHNEYLALHDMLTGLPNRTLLNERLEQAVLGSRRHGTGAGVLLIDLDRFKEINDTLGHDTGDELLRQTGERLRDQLRDVDTVARLGGDEFVVLLPDVDGSNGAGHVADRLLEALHRPFQVAGVDLAVEASIGIACYPDHGDDAGVLMQHADVAMYAAKRIRGTYVVYDPTCDVSSLSSITLLNELRVALEEGQLVLYYQPKEELADGSVRSVEALIRWQHPTRGLLAPDAFLPVAEQTGLINPLTRFVISSALHQVRSWADEGRDVAVAVNLSARNLMDERLPDLVAGLLEEHRLDAGRLEVEVTETSTMIDLARAADVLDALASLGVAITVDDYGTGYSSLSYLRGLPIGTLKIDRSFVTDFLTHPDNAVIVRSTIELAQNLGLRVVAEGVEDDETCAELSRLGCHVAQGYYLARPMPADLLGGLLDARSSDPSGESERLGV